jgi:hypothetical protein
MPFKKCMDSSTFGVIQSLIALRIERNLLEIMAPLIFLIVVGTLIIFRITLLTHKRLE